MKQRTSYHHGFFVSYSVATPVTSVLIVLSATATEKQESVISSLRTVLAIQGSLPYGKLLTFQSIFLQAFFKLISDCAVPLEFLSSTTHEPEEAV